MSKGKAYINLNKMAWKNISGLGPLDQYTNIVRKKILGPLFSVCGNLQFKLLKDELVSLQNLPHIVITGHWRSGTTYLHTLMSGDPQFTFPTTENCLNPHAFMLGSRFGEGKEIKRPMDDVLVTARSPQEDEFALLALGARSPYEGLMFPENLQDALYLADPADLGEHDRRVWEETFCAFIKGVSFLGGGRPVVLKSPTHSYRVKVIAALFPNVKFISIRRNPLEVFESTFRMWRTLFDLYSLGEPIGDEALRELILENRIAMEQKLSQGLAALPLNMVAQVEYERIVENPLRELRHIYATLNLDPEFLTSQRSAQRIDQIQRYTAQKNMPSPEWRRRVFSDWGDFF